MNIHRICYNVSIHFPVDELLNGFPALHYNEYAYNCSSKGIFSPTVCCPNRWQHWNTNLHSQGQGLSAPSVPRLCQLPSCVWLYIFTNLTGTKCYLLVILKVDFKHKHKLLINAA